MDNLSKIYMVQRFLFPKKKKNTGDPNVEVKKVGSEQFISDFLDKDSLYNGKYTIWTSQVWKIWYCMTKCWVFKYSFTGQNEII